MALTMVLRLSMFPAYRSTWRYVGHPATLGTLPPMNTSLAGRRALVCGASQGLGRACAQSLAESGAAVTVLSRSLDRLQAVAADLPGDGHACLAGDMSDPAAVGDLVAKHIAATGTCDILVLNSGGPKGGALADAAPDDLLAGLTPHVLSGQAIMRSVVPGMRDQHNGRIINIVSTSVITPIKGLGVSNTVRGAMNNWMRTLSGELGPHGITVNNILPGFFATDRLTSLMEARAQRDDITAQDVKEAWLATIPAGRLGDPSQLGDLCAFLASPAAAYINGVNLPIDGGRTASG